jgi:HlyD family secretion protein
VNIAKIDFEQAKIDYDRANKLFEKKVLSAEEFEKERVAYNKMKEEYQNAVDNLEIIRDGIAKSSGGYSNTQIRATISGLILDVPVKIGNSVIQSNNFNDGTTICTIADMGDMIFKGSIDESEVGRIREGLPIVLTIGALQDMKFDAVLEYVSPKGVEENGAVMFEIKAAAKIPDSVMVRAGYSANAEIILMQRNNVLAIPEGVVEMVGDSAFVYQLDTTITNEQKFNRVPVTIGMSDGLNIELIDGVEPNARLRGNLK